MINGNEIQTLEKVEKVTNGYLVIVEIFKALLELFRYAFLSNFFWLVWSYSLP